MRPGCGAGGGGAARDRGPGAALHHRAGRDPAPALAASQGQAARHTTSGLSPASFCYFPVVAGTLFFR